MSDDQLFDRHTKPALPDGGGSSSTNRRKNQHSVEHSGAASWDSGYQVGAQDFAGLVAFEIEQLSAALPAFERSALDDLRTKITEECARRWPGFNLADRARRHSPMAS